MALTVSLGGSTMEFETAAGLFSPAHADRGTLATVSYTHLDVYKRQDMCIISYFRGKGKRSKSLPAFLCPLR